MTRIWRPIVFLAIATAMAEAQSPAPPTTPPETASEKETVPPAAAPQTVTLTQVTEVRLELGQRLSAKASTINAPVEFLLHEDLKAGNAVVAKQGPRIIGRVTER